MKVWPKDEQMRKLLRHPIGGAFHDEGPIDWPDDTWTFRRLQDGDVTTETSAEAPAPAPAPAPAEAPAEKKSSRTSKNE